MEKNRMMRLASCLLVLTLLTTCMISGTYAKYTTKAEGSDMARVAKWGVTVTANGSTFAKDYVKNDTTVSTIAKSVVAAASAGEETDNLVAPGTSGTMTKMKLTGTPEVAVKVSYTGSFDISENWTDKDGNFYCPLIITISKTGGSEVKVQQNETITTVDLFEQAVNNAIKAYSKEYEANTDLSEKGDASLTISWEWPFETGTDDDKKTANNVKDTYLGNVAAGTVTGKTAPTVTLTVTTTVTQID